MVSPGEPELAVAEAADMRFVAFLSRIIHLILALSRDVTVVPLWTRSFIRLLLGVLVVLLLLKVGLGDGLDGLHHGCRVQFGGNGGPSQDTCVQVSENTGVVVPGPLPGIGAEVLVGGVCRCQLEEM